MAIVLYKRGDETKVRGIRCIAGRFQPNQLQKCLEDGWVTDPSKLYETINQTLNEIDEVLTGVKNIDLLTDKEIRDVARIAGIKRWETGRISRLKRELGYA